MKTIKGVLSVTILLIGINLMGQDISITSEDACFDSYTGIMDIDFDQYAQDYDLPFSGSYYNLTTGDYEEITVTSNPLLLDNLTAGEYEFQIFISDEDIMEFCWEIFEYRIAEEVEIETFNADCFDDNGRIVVSISSLLMDTGTPIIATILDQSGNEITQKNVFVGLTQVKDLTGGDYYLNIELQNGCEGLMPFTIVDNPLAIPFEVVTTKKACLADGGIDIFVDPTGGPYNIQWQNIDTKQTYYIEDLQNVSSGTYCLTIEKQVGKFDCEYTDTCLVVESALVFLNKTVNHVCDSMSTDGSIFLDAKPKYEYKWDTDPPQTKPYLENLGPGKYCVVAIDSDDCEHHECFTVEVLPQSIDISYDVLAACPEGKGGTIDLYIEPYTDQTVVVWDDIPAGEDNLLTRSDLPAGDYLVTVSNECVTSEQAITLGYDCSCTEWLDYKYLYKDKSDCTESDEGDGFFQYIQTSGLSFLWYDGSTGPKIDGLLAGSYEVTITHDDSQCKKTKTIVVQEEQTAIVEFVNIENACPGDNNGEVEVSIQGTPKVFYWEDLGLDSDLLSRDDLAAGEYTLVVNEACGLSYYSVNIPENGISIVANEFSGCDPFEEVTFDIVGDSPPFVVNWENGDVGTLHNVEPGSYEYTITDSKGCEFVEEYEIANPIEVLSTVKPCPDVSNGSITFQINNPNNDYLTVTYDFGACGECEDFPLIDPTTDSILVISLDNLPGGVPFVFEIDFGDCDFIKSFTLEEEVWEKEYVSSEEIDGIIYCTYDKVCRDIVIEDGFVEPADIDHFSYEDGGGYAWFGAGSCGETDLVCGEDSVGVISGDPIKMRALEARVFYNKLGIVFDEFWEVEIDRNPCRYFWVCPNGSVNPSFGSGDLFGGEYVGEYSIEEGEGCHEIICEIDLGLFSLYDNFIICDSFEFLPEWVEPYVNDSGAESEEKCDEPYQVDAFSIINAYKNKTQLFEVALEGTELLDFILDNLDNPAQNCANITYCNDDFSIIETNIDEIECQVESNEPILILDEEGVTIEAQPCETYFLEDNTAYALCPTECGPKDEGVLECWYVNTFPLEEDLPGIVSSDEDPKSQSRNVVIQPQSESTSFYTYTQYITEYGELIYKPLVITDDGQARLNLLSNRSYVTFPLDNIVFAHEDFRDGYRYTIVGKEGSYQLTSGVFSNVEMQTLESSGDLNIRSNDFREGKIFLSGEFTGNLQLNNSTILSNALPTRFSLKLDDKLNILEVDYSNEINTTVFHSNGKFLEIGTSSGSNAPTINSNTSTQILQYYYDPETNKQFLIVKGAGILTSSATNIELTNEAALSLLCIEDNDFAWSKEIAEFNIIDNNVPIAMDEDENIYVGISFKNQLVLENLAIDESNQGSFDNIILKLSKGGELESYHLVSNASDEIIEEMRIANRAISFGTTAKEYEFTRKIGELTFFQFDNQDSKGISSYLRIDEMMSFTHHRGIKDVSEDSFAIVPNPASDRITVSSTKHSINLMQIQIFNINGKLVHTEDQIHSISKTLDVSALKAGVYTIKIATENLNYFTQKLILTK